MEIDQFLVEMPVPAGPLRWATAWAHWGDTIACMSYAKWILDKKGQATCNFVYTGPDGRIVDFLKAQPWIRNVVQGLMSTDYNKAYALACNEMSDPAAWLPLITPAVADRDPLWPSIEDVTPTHPSFLQAKMYRTVPVMDLQLPKACENWAERFWRTVQKRTTGPVITVHPSSIWSESANNHWPHWKEAIGWLLEHTPYTYILSGLVEGFAPEGGHPRLIDTVGKIPSCMEMLAISKKCAGVISTPNCVSLWSVSHDIPGLIMGNRVMDNFAYFFRRYVDRLPNRFVNWDAPFSEFQRLAAAWTVSPRTYVDVLRVEERVREDRWRTNTETQAKLQKAQGASNLDARLGRTYRILGGIVAGRGVDHYKGAVVRAEELNGDPSILVGMGVIESCEITLATL